MVEFEKSLHQKGYKYIVGVDEAGRGSLAGPVVVAAVIFPPDIEPFIQKDSKKLTPKQREELFKQIQQKALSITIGIADNTLIDRINVLNATKVAIKRALDMIKIDYDIVITDHINLEGIKHISEKKADENIHCVAAASIIAKVYRDNIMKEFKNIYPDFSFDKHKGYPTKNHIFEIKQYGITPIHRKSFRLYYE